MAFGRLDVYLPSGEFKTFSLHEDSISIGRSPGSTIALDTDSLSRYHASLIRQDGTVLLTDLDSINGTFVDGTRLTANSAHTLYGGEEIIIGDVRLVFQMLDDSPTRPMLVLEDATRRLARTELPFFVEIEAPEFPIPPGAHISSTIRISNTGDSALRFRIEIGGLPDGWARQDRREVEIAGGGAGTVVINFKPRRRSESKPGDYSVLVVVSVVDQPDLKLSGVVILRVLPFGSFGMALEPPARRPAAGADSAPGTTRMGVPMRLHLHNGGSAPLPIRLIARDLDEALRLQIEPSALTLAPGARAVVMLIAHPRRTRYFGEARAYSFDIVARSTDAAAFAVPVRATVDERPPLPGWAVFALGGLAVALVALLIVGALILLQPRAAGAAIDRFVVLNADPAQIAQTEALRVEWTAQNVDTIRILIDELEVHRDTAAQGTIALDTAALFGDHQLSLLVSGENGSARQDLPIRVIAPLTVGTFSYAPRPLMLYVTQTLTLDWQVPGAGTTRVAGLQDFSFSAPTGDAPFGEVGSLTLSGIALAPLTLTLDAERDGAVVSQRYDLEMTSPQCGANTGDVPLRALPDGSGQVVATVPSGTTVVVDAQDSFGRWLRVQLAGGARGWGERTALNCVGFSPDDLYKAIDALPPVPSLPPPGTLSSAATATTIAPVAPLIVPTQTPAG
ncbi:MAG: FHA domain-containing protein [Chloroflexota bacterium]|nr:FHA domain-containing protein [Chloroflexota bacterium]